MRGKNKGKRKKLGEKNKINIQSAENEGDGGMSGFKYTCPSRRMAHYMPLCFGFRDELHASIHPKHNGTS